MLETEYNICKISKTFRVYFREFKVYFGGIKVYIGDIAFTCEDSWKLGIVSAWFGGFLTLWVGGPTGF